MTKIPETKSRRRPAAKPAPAPKYRVYDREGRAIGDHAKLAAAKKSTSLVGATIQTLVAPAQVWRRCPIYWVRER